MCLAVPGRLIERYEAEGGLKGRVQFGGIHREVCLEFLPEVQVGEYVLVHVGFAISSIDEDEAQRTYECLEKLGMLDGELNVTPMPIQDGVATRSL